MPKYLTQIEKKLYHYKDGDRIDGSNLGLSGNCTELSGDCSELSGDCSGLSGNCSGLSGDLNEITLEERKENSDLRARIKD